MGAVSSPGAQVGDARSPCISSSSAPARQGSRLFPCSNTTLEFGSCQAGQVTSVPSISTLVSGNSCRAFLADHCFRDCPSSCGRTHCVPRDALHVASTGEQQHGAAEPFQDTRPRGSRKLHWEEPIRGSLTLSSGELGAPGMAFPTCFVPTNHVESVGGQSRAVSCPLPPVPHAAPTTAVAKDPEEWVGYWGGPGRSPQRTQASSRWRSTQRRPRGRCSKQLFTLVPRAEGWVTSRTA